MTTAHEMVAGIWEDPCHPPNATFDQLPHRPLNSEHPPVAKLILYSSVRALDTTRPNITDWFDPAHPAFSSCGFAPRIDPNESNLDLFQAELGAKGNPWSWRLPSVAMGVVTVTCTGLAAWRLFGRISAGLAAGGLVLLDGLIFTSSRVAMLDIYATGFSMAALWCATYANRWGRIGAALLWGLSFSSKYVAAFTFAPIVLVACWAHHREGSLRRRAPELAASLLGIPPAVWLLSYAHWLHEWISQRGWLWALRHWAQVQKDGFTYLSTFTTPGHGHTSSPLEWLALSRPLLYASPTDVSHASHGHIVFAIGNPIVWWDALAAIVVTLFAYGRQRFLTRKEKSQNRHAQGRDRKWGSHELACLLPALVFLPFLLLHRSAYLYYMTIVVPFFAIALAGALQRLWSTRRAWGKAACVSLGALAILAFIHYLPVMDGRDIQVSEAADILRAIPWTTL